MNQKERMLGGLPFKPWLDGLSEERLACQKKLRRFQELPPEDWEGATALLKEIFGKTGETLHVVPPLFCDYGTNIQVGENFFANYHFTVLDSAPVVIGENAQIGPNVSLYTAGHPMYPDARNSGYEWGMPITIGKNVWIGGNTVVCPGVTIGDCVVIGAGSVVTKDIPSWTVVVGNPCRVIREITEADRDFYYRDRKFDVDDYLP